VKQLPDCLGVTGPAEAYDMLGGHHSKTTALGSIPATVRSDEIRGAGEILGKALVEPATLAQGLHEAVAIRPFRALGPAAAPVRLMHDGISRALYAGVRRAIETAPKLGAAIAAEAHPSDAPPLSRSVRGSLALGALNGVAGDVLARRANALALPMTIRQDGQDVATDGAALAQAFSNPTPKVAVFVHGLCETDDAWRLAPRSDGPKVPGTYGSHLERDLGYTPVYLRYNTGLRISENGRRLAALLEELVAEWPAPIEELTLIGHSMGGLVARSACHYGSIEGLEWTAAVRHVFCLGSPHLGAPLEKAANLAGWALRRVPETRPFAKAVNRRSVGIKDLRFGSVVEEDWSSCDPDELLRDRCTEVPFLEHASYYFVGATVTRDARHPVGRLVGDLLVQLPSASGRGRRRRIPFELDNGRHVGGLTHFDLLNHPDVYEQMRQWLEPDRADRKALGRAPRS
jgi:pimeloyl-ACP methyl ester carboxylesterase